MGEEDNWVEYPPEIQDILIRVREHEIEGQYQEMLAILEGVDLSSLELIVQARLLHSIAKAYECLFDITRGSDHKAKSIEALKEEHSCLSQSRYAHLLEDQMQQVLDRIQFGFFCPTNRYPEPYHDIEDDDEIWPLYEAALKSHKEGNYPRTENCYKRLVSIYTARYDPFYYQILREYCSVLNINQKPQESIRVMETYIGLLRGRYDEVPKSENQNHLAPTHLVVRANAVLAQAYFAAGEYSTAQQLMLAVEGFWTYLTLLDPRFTYALPYAREEFSTSIQLLTEISIKLQSDDSIPSTTEPSNGVTPSFFSRPTTRAQEAVISSVNSSTISPFFSPSPPTTPISAGAINPITAHLMAKSVPYRKTIQ